MKIQFNFTLEQGDLNELNRNFNSVEFVENKLDESNSTIFTEVTVDTKDLIFEEFDDYIENWLNAGYKLEKEDNSLFYTLTPR